MVNSPEKNLQMKIAVVLDAFDRVLGLLITSLKLIILSHVSLQDELDRSAVIMVSRCMLSYASPHLMNDPTVHKKDRFLFMSYLSHLAFAFQYPS